MSNDRRTADANLDVVTSALEQGLNSCRSVLKNYRAMLEQRPDAEQVDVIVGGACSLQEIDQMDDRQRENRGTGSGLEF